MLDVNCLGGVNDTRMLDSLVLPGVICIRECNGLSVVLSPCNIFVRSISPLDPRTVGTKECDETNDARGVNDACWLGTRLKPGMNPDAGLTLIDLS